VPETIVVCGATGRQGGAVARSLLQRGWAVRAITRRPDKKKARILSDDGAQVIQADMDDPKSLLSAFEGVDGVYSVQNGIGSGFEREVEQGRNVADAARAAGVRHFVYGSAGSGKAGTGVPSWESKVPVEEHIRRLALPYTMLRPLAFMELMSDPSFYPSIGTWRIFPQLTGENREIPWLSVDDLGTIAANAFTRPDDYIGKEITLAADVRTLAECRSLYREILGREPRTFPMPIWLFDRFTRKDPTTMWRWLRTGKLEFDTEVTRALAPSAKTVREWLAGVRQRQADTDGHERGEA
jgi:uncharacterized protein YbjT (DUF2867 family)